MWPILALCVSLWSGLCWLIQDVASASRFADWWEVLGRGQGAEPSADVTHTLLTADRRKHLGETQKEVTASGVTSLTVFQLRTVTFTWWTETGCCLNSCFWEHHLSSFETGNSRILHTSAKPSCMFKPQKCREDSQLSPATAGHVMPV